MYTFRFLVNFSSVCSSYCILSHFTDDDSFLDLSMSSTKSDCEDSMSISSPTSVTNHANALTQVRGHYIDSNEL